MLEAVVIHPPRWFVQAASALSASGLLGALCAAAPAHAAPPPCPSRGDPRSTDYQFRPQMDRCEGIRRERPISADGMWLASYTIGQPQSERRAEGG
ncbi:MAG: hypothetical protein ACK46L_02620, partial [Synechococcaceae cyanobacterium]